MKYKVYLHFLPHNCFDCPFCYDYSSCMASYKYPECTMVDDTRRGDYCPIKEEEE